MTVSRTGPGHHLPELTRRSPAGTHPDHELMALMQDGRAGEVDLIQDPLNYREECSTGDGIDAGRTVHGPGAQAPLPARPGGHR